jgi:endonuclease/exonuclease/phosphatase family metal-dependent hydrolase
MDKEGTMAAGPGSSQPAAAFDLAKGIDAAIVDKRFRGTDRYLDLVTWNIRWFNSRDPQRVENMVTVLSALNADILVLQEIELGSLEEVAGRLSDAGVGLYKVAYGTSGGDQRIAMLYDTEWVRAKDDVREIVGKREVTTRAGKDAFPRLPLWGYFTGLPVNVRNEAFDFQLVGVHLKSQLGDGVTDKEQRSKAATWLAHWLEGDAQQVDSDVLIVGDWNEPPSSDTWQPFADLEAAEKVYFRSVNDDDAISHLMYKRKDDIGSRLDLKVASATVGGFKKADPQVVRWTTLSKLLAGSPSAAQLKLFIKEVSRDLSDHMPVVSRFFFTPRRRR